VTILKQAVANSNENEPALTLYYHFVHSARALHLEDKHKTADEKRIRKQLQSNPQFLFI
jgi:hypothetical protein